MGQLDAECLNLAGEFGDLVVEVSGGFLASFASLGDAKGGRRPPGLGEGAEGLGAHVAEFAEGLGEESGKTRVPVQGVGHGSPVAAGA